MMEEKYNDFVVYKSREKNVFIHLNINNDIFYDKLISFFFEEEKLLGYIYNKSFLKFDGSVEQFVSLFKMLSGFIDDENLQVDIDILKKELKNYIDWEEYSDEALLTLRRDKIGKVGEYILHNILSDYFGFTCILPKLALTTNKNMSVFGIDVIFWNENENMMLFGESKVSKDLDNGINLINRSLTNYEKEICEEYRTILSAQLFNNNIPAEIKQYIGKAINFKKFIEIAGVNKIGIPLFIMNGDEVDVESIMNKLDRINKINFLNLEVIYYVINIPIVDKNIFQSKIINYLRERCDYYESQC